MDDRYLSELDPDVHFFEGNSISTSDNCKYFQIADFNEHQRMNNQFSMMHLNIRSMSKHFDELQLFLNTMDLRFDCLGFSETWYTPENNDNFELAHFTQYKSFRSSRPGGGASLYVGNHLVSHKRDDLIIPDASVDSVFAEIEKQSLQSFPQNVVIGVIYRPPNTDLSQFNDHLEMLLTKIKGENKLCYLLGDYNVDLLKVEAHYESGRFLDIMYSHSFQPHITKPTRIANSSASLIDNIFSNSIYFDITNSEGIICSDLTDHYPIFHISGISNTSSSDEIGFKRVFTEKNKKKFSSMLQIGVPFYKTIALKRHVTYFIVK